MSAGTPSLLTFLDAPIVVGDPQGFVTYVNPAFEKVFRADAESARGQALATVFDGGAREAVLAAVAGSCSSGESVRFRVRHGSKGYSAVASPIVANDANIGVVILLAESAAADERCLALQRELEEPFGEIERALGESLEQSGGRRSERYRILQEEGLRALTRARKGWAELGAVLSGTAESDPAKATLDPVRVVRDAAARVRERFAEVGVDLEVLLPNHLPTARGDGARLEKALVWLLESRAQSALDAETVTVAARTVGRGDRASVMITVVDSPGGDAESTTGDEEAREIGGLISSLGGDIRTSSDVFAGRTTAIRLAVG